MTWPNLRCFVATLIFLGSFVTGAMAQSADPTVWPMRVSEDRKYLVNSSGQPVLMVGDSAWSLIVELGEQDALTYLDDRKAKGVNLLIVNLIEHTFSSHTPPWRNQAGQDPFFNVNDFTTENSAYFDHAEWVIQQALARNMLVMLVPSYMGSSCGSSADEGWCLEMRANGTDRLREYGNYLGERFAKYPNIIWTHIGDQYPSDSDMGLALAVRDGILDKNTGQFTAYHLVPNSLPSSDSRLLPNDIDTVYTYDGQTAYSRDLDAADADRGIRPFIFMEGAYENEHHSSSAIWRAQMYPTILAGGSGYLFGNNPIWLFWDPGDPVNPYTDGGFAGGWTTALDSPGSISMQRAGEFFNALEWYSLKPDTAHTVMTSGFGTPGTSSYVLMSVNDNRTLGVAYYQATLTPTVDLGQMAGPVTAQWFDPSSGTYTRAGGPFRNSGTRQFTPPGLNADGQSDWLLLLRTWHCGSGSATPRRWRCRPDGG